MNKLAWALAAVVTLTFAAPIDARAETPPEEPAGEGAADITEPLAFLLLGTGLAGVIGAARGRYLTEGADDDDGRG